jgi:hypothetical protein
MGNCVISGPNEAVVVSGLLMTIEPSHAEGGCLSNSQKVVVGGWQWACWGVTNVSR